MKRLRRAVFALAAVCLLPLGAAWWLYAHSPLTLREQRLDVDIERGSAGQALVGSLQQQGIDLRGWQYALAMRWRGDASRIRAGSYVLESPLTLKGLLDRLTRGDVSLREVVLIEGWTFRQVRAALARQSDLRQEAALLDDAALLQAVGASESHPEGLFAPDTYAFSRGTSDLEVLRRAYRLQQQRLQTAWSAASRAGAPLPLKSPYELLVLASIVEKETGREADRGKVAAVFVNRLNRSMMLQSDPTTIYGMGDQFDGNLRRRDLRTDTPYNTYTRMGLPPTPIAMPGRASLAAVTSPAASQALYFVARGDGSSEFSDDLAAHNRAVTRYQKKAP